MHLVLLDGFIIGNAIHPGIEGVFRLISIDLNAPWAFQVTVVVGGSCNAPRYVTETIRPRVC